MRQDAVGKWRDSGFKQQCRPLLAQGGRYVSVDDGFPIAVRKDLELIDEVVRAGKLKAIIDTCYPLDELVMAHSYVDKGHKKGNVIVSI